MNIQAVEYEELPKSVKNELLLNKNLEIIKDVKVKIEAVISGTEITVGELFALMTDSTLKLNREAGAPVDLMVDGKIIGHGALVVIDDNFGVQITKIKT